MTTVTESLFHSRRNRTRIPVIVVLLLMICIVSHAMKAGGTHAVAQEQAGDDVYAECQKTMLDKEWTALMRCLRRIPSDEHDEYTYAFYKAQAYYGLGFIEGGDIEQRCCLDWMKHDGKSAESVDANSKSLEEARTAAMRNREIATPIWSSIRGGGDGTISEGYKILLMGKLEVLERRLEQVERTPGK